jgi:hypothetical protein
MTLRPRLDPSTFFAKLKWIDGRPLLDTIEPYRREIFRRASERREDGVSFRYNLVLEGRPKKNWRSSDLVLACLVALFDDSPGGNQVYLVANDEGQAGDDLELAKKLMQANPVLAALVTVRKNRIERKDGHGFIEVLPAQDAIGAHGKTYRLLAIDEIHATARTTYSRRWRWIRRGATPSGGSRPTPVFITGQGFRCLI